MRVIKIGLLGAAGCGKTTFANELKRWLVLDHRVETHIISFAAPIKRALNHMGVLDEWDRQGNTKGEVLPEIGCSPRHLMQTLGTEWGRNTIRPDLWVILWRRQVFKQVEQYVSPDCHKLVIADDVRFDNCMAEFDVCFRVEGGTGNDKVDSSHPSETLPKGADTLNVVNLDDARVVAQNLYIRFFRKEH